MSQPSLTIGEERHTRAMAMLDDFLNTEITLEDLRPRLCLTLRPRDTGVGVIRRPLLNVDLMVCLKLDQDFQTGVFGVRPELARYFGKSEETFFQMAANNTRKDIVTKSMTSMLMGLSDIPDVDDEPKDDDNMMFVCTTKDHINGAVALNYPEVFQAFCEKHGFSGIFILPSSIHELILIPDYAASPDDLANMVQEINEAMVDEDQRLDPVVYTYQQEAGEVTIAASAM